MTRPALTTELDWARAMPAGFARLASRGRWEAARHLTLLNQMAMDCAARRIRRLMVFMPPRHGKSTFISQYFPTWYLGTFPDEEIILGSYEAGYASTWGSACRDLMAEYGPELWGIDVQHNRRAGADWRLTGTHLGGKAVTGGMRTAGVGSGLTGRGGHILIIDDPFKDDAQANSKTYRDRVWNWYQSTFYSRRNEEDSVIILVMTRWHEDDLAGRLLAAQESGGDQWEVVNLPALCEDSATDPFGRADGEALWPEKWGRESLLQTRAMLSPYWWAALYQQRPAPSEGGLFKRVWWRFWQPWGSNYPPPVIDIPDGADHVPILVHLPRQLDRVVQSWDLSFTGSADASYVVGQTWGQKRTDAFLLDQVRKQMDFPETLDEFRRVQREWPETSHRWVEKAANGEALFSMLRHEIPGIVRVPVQGSKEDRASRTTAYVEGGNVYLPHPIIAPWVRELIEELSAFPNAAKDDQVDTLTQALTKMFHGASPIAAVGDYQIVRR